MPAKFAPVTNKVYFSSITMPVARPHVVTKYGYELTLSSNDQYDRMVQNTRTDPVTSCIV